MHPIWKNLLAAACLFSSAFCISLSPVEASQISIEVKPFSRLTTNSVVIGARIANNGDEAARLVQLAASFGTNFAPAAMMDVLGTNSPFRTETDVGPWPTPPGVHTAVIKVRYCDAAGYPFTAVSSIPVHTADIEDLSDSLKARLGTLRIRKSGTVTASLSTTIKTGTAATVQLILPDELRCNTASIETTIAYGKKTKIAFDVENVSARSGSRYPILIKIDYMKDGFHRSIVASGMARVLQPWNPFGSVSFRTWMLIIAALFALTVCMQFCGGVDGAGPADRPQNALQMVALCILIAFIGYHIPPDLLLLDTTTAGGDTVAHNYMASHLKKSLFESGRVVSWAGGWWSGFPLFQFYFPLPYLLMVLLDVALPFNIALKLVSVLGIFLLPVCAFAAARIMRVPRPAPILFAAATIPFLFDCTHTIWGVNIYSTLAGMIANSISFSLMLLFIACSWRDADDGEFRPITALLLAATMASHFFTTVIAGIVIAIYPLLRPRSGMLRATLTLAKEGILGVMLMAWWLIPLIAKREFSMDFGTNWELHLWRDMPVYLVWMLPLAALAIPFGIVHRSRFVAVCFWMFLTSAFLLVWGYDGVSPVFVNVRLWPFAAFALMGLAAAGAGFALSALRVSGPASAACILAALVFGPMQPNNVRSWAQWNYEGLEKKPRWPVIRDLVLPLDGTPGRLANELSGLNDSLGSSRVFECVPHLISKPILEGGIVNSAVGSMFSYYVQSESSQTAAGAPPIVKTTTFNFANATKHFELFNVKHFIAVTEQPKRIMAESKDWRFMRGSQGWELYELMTHDGKYVSIPEYNPWFVEVDDWKEAALEWIYTIEALDQPFLLLRDGEAPPAQSTVIEIGGFRNYLASRRKGEMGNPPHWPTRTELRNVRVISEEVTDSRISFKTTGLGFPHLIKCSYHPNWRVSGARKIYMVTPCFMVVYPDKNDVELYYGSTLSDYTGMGLSMLACVVLMTALGRRMGKQNKDEVEPNT